MIKIGHEHYVDAIAEQAKKKQGGSLYIWWGAVTWGRTSSLRGFFG
jgi:hypothetical protein